MQVYRLTEIREVSPTTSKPLYYGRYMADVQEDGTILCDNRQFAVADVQPLPAGQSVMIWCSRDYFCCPTADYNPGH